MTLEDIQKGRFDCGAIVYNTNNKRFAVVLDGKRGNAKEPCSYVVQQWRKGFVTHTPLNRTLIPTGKFIDMGELLEIAERKLGTPNDCDE